MNVDLSAATWVAISGVFGLGIAMSILGSIKIKLTENLKIDDADMGKMFSSFMLSNCLFVIFTGILCDTLGFKLVAIIGFVAGFIAIFLLAQAKSKGVAYAACFILGIGGMALNSVGNTLLSKPEILFHNPVQSANMGNVFFGVGAFIVPMLVGWLFRKTSFANAVNVIAVIILVPVVLSFIADLPKPQGSGFSLDAAMNLIVQPQIIVCALALVCYIALEASMGGWISTYMKAVGADDTKANMVLSIFWISMMVGRLLTALVIGNIISLTEVGSWFIMGLAIFAMVILFLLTTINSVGKATICMILIGLAFAPMFPTIAGLMFSRTAPELGGTGFGIIFAIGLIGGIFIPAWMGKISAGKDIKASMVVASGTAGVLVVIALCMAMFLPAPLAAKAAPAKPAAIEQKAPVQPAPVQPAPAQPAPAQPASAQPAVQPATAAPGNATGQ